MKKRIDIVINPAKKPSKQPIPIVLSTRKEIPDKVMTKYVTFGNYVGRMLNNFGNTCISMKYAELGGDAIVRSIKKQFGIDVIAYISENDTLILERVGNNAKNM